jgi:hypothetical protein
MEEKKEQVQGQVDKELLIEAIETSKDKVKVSKYQEENIIPKHPFRAILSGASGSGKTNLLINLLTKEKFYKDFFDVIFLISPTAGKLDDSYIALKESKTKSKLAIINVLDPETTDDIMTINKDIIEDKGVDKAPKILIVYDDIISDTKYMNSRPFVHSFVASRHYNASVIICTQRFNSVPRVCRIQANAIFYFKGTNSEQETLAQEFCPAGYHWRKEFLSIIDHATDKKYSFLFINGQADREDRYRIGLDRVMKLLK